MKRWTFLAVTLLVVMAVLPAAAAGPDVKLSGPHWELHLIGVPHGISGDDSSGHSIMIPLKNAGKNGVESISCEGKEVIYDPDPALFYTDQEPAGAKLYWQVGDTFDIIDRDATDGSATIQIPWMSTDHETMAVDVYVRIHGKPGTCLKATAWAVDSENATGDTYYFKAGSIQLNRKTGRATWTQVNDMFDVTWCDLENVYDADGNVVGVQCKADSTVENLSVFSDVFSAYFWNIANNGARNVEIRLYPTE